MADNKQGMPAPRRRAEEPEEHENAERWLLTYADMITLLVAFFIMLYSMSVVNTAKFEALAISVKSGFGGISKGNRGNWIQAKSIQMFGEEKGSPEASKKKGMAAANTHAKDLVPVHTEVIQSVCEYVTKQLASISANEILQPMLDVESIKGNRMRVIMSDQIFFDKGSTDLLIPEVDRVKKIGASIKNFNFKISVEGYSSPVDDDATDTSSWNISTQRAIKVLDLLFKEGINPRRLSAIGYGQWTNPGQTRKLAMTGKGEWKDLEPQGENEYNRDRVIVSVLIE